MNEIPWAPWGPDAFERARREHKPILLSISAVWCHWCHVMDGTTYADPEIAATIARRFVAVRVDNDQRPDVNARYNMGGWPTTAFLAEDGTTLTGATYVPPPQMRSLLDEIASWYGEHREEVLSEGAARFAAHAARAPSPPYDLRSADVARIIEAIAATFDETYAGFGDAPKFPQPELLETLLVAARATGDERLHAMVVRTLLAMSRGGMYDRVEGGFFRYSTTRDWSVPHFEKMAEDHAGLLRVLALVLTRGEHEELHATLRSALAYVTTVLLDPATGFFAGSQDADEAYYALPLPERRAREAPYVDRTVYAAWNAELAGALCLCGGALDDDAIVALGTQTLDAIWRELRDADELFYHVRRPGEPPSVRGLLADQLAYVRAALDAHEITGEARFLERAIAVAALVIDRFAADSGGFYDHAAIETALGRLAMRDRPIVENALFAESLLRLAELDAQERYREIAERALTVYASSFTGAGAFAASYARAAQRFLAPRVSVRIVATLEDGAEFREAARRLPSPFVGVRSVAPADASVFDLPTSPAPAAYLCSDRTCGPPVRTAAAIRDAYDAIAV